MNDAIPTKRWVQAQGKCDKCQADIVWAVNGESGARTPLDLEPNANDGKLLLHPSTMRFVKLNMVMIERAIERGDPLYTNHLATCRVRKGEREAA